MLAELPLYIQDKPDLTNPPAQIFWCYIDWNIFTTFSVCFFSYTCQVQLLIVYYDLKAPSLPLIQKVITRSIILDMTFYIIIGCAGYFSLYNHTDTVVIERPKP